MKLNADLGRRAVALTDELPWQWSPDRSVQRRMLDRDGEEVARATSLVKYPAGSSFPAHKHGAGEEFLVLEGVFSDDFGDYPAGTYVRNPPGSAHSPSSREGCLIFVKLRQFDPEDLERVVVDTSTEDFSPTRHPGLVALELHRFSSEHVRILRAEAPATLEDLRWPGGAEYLVLSGELADDNGRYPAGAWLRLPSGSRQRLRVSSDAVFYLKTGHLISGGA
jgi:quercetin dioxygenase-like cupin family protein